MANSGRHRMDCQEAANVPPWPGESASRHSEESKSPATDHLPHLPMMLKHFLALIAVLLLSMPLARAQAAGSAISFNGTTGYVSVPLVSPPVSNYTLSAWVFLRTGGTLNGNRMAILSSTVAGASIEFLLRATTENATDPQYLELGRFNSFNGASSTTPVPMNTWTHVAVTVSADQIVSYFINGSPAGSWSAGGLNVSLGSNVNLGDNSGQRRFDGLLDEVQIWDRALSPAEIQSDWNRSRSGSESGLYAYYRCNEGTGTNTADGAANGGAANGTLQSGTQWVVSVAPIINLFVTTTADSGAGSLRAAVDSAPNNSTLTLDPSLTSQTITLTTGELLISKNLTINGPVTGNLTISGNNASRIFNVSSGSTLNLTGLILRNGRSINGVNSTTAGSPGGNGLSGGGVFNAGTLNLTNCTLTANRTGDGGNGWPAANPPSSTPTTSGGVGGLGGAIYNQGILRLVGCTVYGNGCGDGGFGGIGNFTTNTGGTGGRGGDGGGIHNANGGSLTLQSSTVTANNSGNGRNGGNGPVGQFGNPGASGGIGGNGGSGGGISSAGSFTLTACTISGNSSGNGGNSSSGGSGGGVMNSVGTKIACNNTIIAANSAATAPDVSGEFNSAGYNLIGRIEGSSGFGVVTDRFGFIAFPLNPLLGALANNGGGILTMALLPASPALDAGNDSLLGILANDQRGVGFPRQRGARVDIGAFELDLSGFSAPTIVTQSAGSVTTFPLTYLSGFTVSATVNPNGFVSMSWLEFGLTTSYGSNTAPVALGSGNVNSALQLPLAGLAPGLTWHYRVVATSAAGTSYGPNQTLSISVAGDTNGNGVVSQQEFDAVRTALQGNEIATQNAAGYYTQAQVQAIHVNTPLLSQTSPGRFKLTLGIQKTTNLANIPFTDFPMNGSGLSTTINGAGKLEFEFPATDNAAFFRVAAP
jgi:hypothetical protein